MQRERVLARSFCISETKSVIDYNVGIEVSGKDEP